MPQAGLSESLYEGLLPSSSSRTLEVRICHERGAAISARFTQSALGNTLCGRLCCQSSQYVCIREDGLYEPVLFVITPLRSFASQISVYCSSGSVKEAVQTQGHGTAVLLEQIRNRHYKEKSNTVQKLSTDEQPESGDFIHCELPGLLQDLLSVLRPLLGVKHVGVCLRRGHLVRLTQQLLDSLKDLVHSDRWPPVLVLHSSARMDGQTC